MKETENSDVTAETRWSKIVIEKSILGQEMQFTKKTMLHIVKPLPNTRSSMHNYAVVMLDITPNMRLVLAQHICVIRNLTRPEEGRKFRACFLENCLDSGLQ